MVELLLAPGVGARTVQSLAMVAEVVHGAAFRFDDPARFSLAHGGKDRHPHPVPTKVYDETIRVLKSAVDKARLGNGERLEAIRRLDDQARRLECTATGPDFSEYVRSERERSHALGGRSVFGWEPAPSDEKGAEIQPKISNGQSPPLKKVVSADSTSVGSVPTLSPTASPSGAWTNAALMSCSLAASSRA